MPYMRCNEKIVSRYDPSSEVNKCKSAEKLAHYQAYELCTSNQECAKSRELMSDTVIVSSVVIAAIVLGLCVWARHLLGK